MEKIMLRRKSIMKEDTYMLSELKPSEQKALQALKNALAASEEISCNNPSFSTMWGVSLLGGTPRAGVILLKFLRARNFIVSDALTVLLNCLAWRNDYGAEKILTECLTGFEDLKRIAFSQWYSREGHPMRYFGIAAMSHASLLWDKKKEEEYRRWRIQEHERDIKKLLDLSPGGVNFFISVIDLKDAHTSVWDFINRLSSSNSMSSFVNKNYYPQLVAHQIFINVPWKYKILDSIRLFLFTSKEYRSKTVISTEGNATKTLSKFMRPVDIPALLLSSQRRRK